MHCGSCYVIAAQAGILRSSSHPLSLACLYLFRSAALAVYVLCGLFTDNYVLSVSEGSFLATKGRTDKNGANYIHNTLRKADHGSSRNRRRVNCVDGHCYIV